MRSIQAHRNWRDAARRSAGRGYTLLELLIVVALLGLASAIVVPQLVAGDSLNTQAAVRMVIADLVFAQSDALAHQEFRKVHFYEDGSGYCITRVTEGNYGTAFDEDTADYVIDPLSDDAGEYIVNLIDDDRFDNVTISAVSIDTDEGRELIFDPIGGTVRSGGQPGLGGAITVSANDTSYRINIAAITGKLTVELLEPDDEEEEEEG